MRAFLELAVGAAIAVTARSAASQEIVLTGPLAGAPTLLPSGDWRAERLELAVTPGLSLGSNDEPALLVGGEVHYFPWDRFGAGLWGTAAFPWGERETALHAAGSAELVVVPVTGKAKTFCDGYFRFDVHLLGGPAIVAASNRSGENETTWVPQFGIGFRGFSAKFFSNSLDYRLLLGDPVRHLVTLSFSFWVLEVDNDL